MNVSIVIPSYNRRDSVLALLDDLRAQKGGAFEVIVSDDASPDGSADAVAAAHPWVTLLRAPRNGGPCVARNRGIRAATGPIVVGLDSDVRVPDRRLLARIAETFAEAPPDVHGLALRLFQPDGVTDDIARWWHPQPARTHAGRAFETSYFSGTAYAFRREALLATGLFPEILYMHYEEVEVAWRVLDAGGRIIHCPHLSVEHHEHQISRRSEVRTFYKVRNQILLAAGCLPLTEGVGFTTPRVAFAGWNALRGGYAGSFTRAIVSAARLLPERLRARRPLRPETRRRIADLRRSRHATEPFATIPLRATPQS